MDEDIYSNIDYRIGDRIGGRIGNVPEINMRSRLDLPMIPIAMQALANLQHGHSAITVCGGNSEFLPEHVKHDLCHASSPALLELKPNQPYPMCIGTEEIKGDSDSYSCESDDMAIIDNAIYGSRISFDNETDVERIEIENFTYGKFDKNSLSSKGVKVDAFVQNVTETGV